MNEEFTSNLDLSFIFGNISATLDAFATVSKNVRKMVNNDAIISALERVAEIAKETIKIIEKLINKNFSLYTIIELSIPNSNIVLNDYDHVPQGPPLKEKSIKETAVENLHYNMNKFKNYKLIKLIKEKCPAFVDTLIFEILIYIIFKALGMQ